MLGLVAFPDRLELFWEWKCQMWFRQRERISSELSQSPRLRVDQHDVCQQKLVHVERGK